MAYAYFNNQIVDENEALVSIRTHAFNYGTAIFEGIKAYYIEANKAWYIFRLDDHYRRFANSASLLGLELKVTFDGFLDIFNQLIKRNNFKSDVYIRPMLYTDRLGIGMAKPTGCSFAIYIEPFPPPQLKELRSMIVDTIRTPSEAIPSSGKIAGAYVNNYLAQKEAARNGYDTAILKTMEGLISEAFGMAVFMVKGNTLSTPRLEDDILESVTRKTIMHLAKLYLKMSINESPIPPEILLDADEVFVCGTGSAVNAVVSIGNKIIGDGKGGAITKRLSELYLQAVRNGLVESSQWCYKVPSIDQ